MKKIFLYLILFLTLFSSHSFGELSFVQTKDVTSDTPGVRGINFKPDGKIMYITSRLKDSEDAYVVQYSLSTPFDISTATRSFNDGDGTQLACSTNMKLPHAIEFKPDGTKMFVATNKDFNGNPGVAIFQFKLTTAWDSSTLVCEKIYEVNEIGVYVENQLRTLAFKPDGTRMFVGGKNTDKIRQFDLSNAWDLSSGVTPGEISDSLLTSDTSMRNIQFNSDGTALYIAGDTNARMNKYTLSTAYDITTLSSTFSTFDLGSRVNNMRGFIFAANFTKLFVTSDGETSATTDKIHEYDLQCAGTISCTDPSANADVKAIIEANVEMSKRVIRNNTLPIFHRIEWLRRHKNKDNLSNLNASIDFQNQKIAKLANTFDAFKKERDRTYRSNDWFDWSEGRFVIGEKNVSNTSSRDIQNYGISFGTDRIDEDDRDLMYGYVFQFGKDDVDIGSNGSNLNTNTYSLAAYRTKIKDNDYFTDGIIGLSLLEIDHHRVVNGNKLDGNRDGQQIFGSINFGKRLHDKDLNLNPSVKLELGYTKLKPFNEKTILGSSLADALHYRDQNIKTAIATVGVLFDTTEKGDIEEEIINHHGRLEFIGDLSPSSDAEFYYMNDQSTIYEYKSNNRSKYNYRIGYGIDRTSMTGWSIVANFERFGSSGGYYDEFYFLLGYVPIDEMKFSFELDESNKTSLKFSNKIYDFNLKVAADYNFFIEEPNYNTNLLLSNSF